MGSLLGPPTFSTMWLTYYFGGCPYGTKAGNILLGTVTQTHENHWNMVLKVLSLYKLMACSKNNIASKRIHEKIEYLKLESRSVERLKTI